MPLGNANNSSPLGAFFSSPLNVRGLGERDPQNWVRVQTDTFDFVLEVDSVDFYTQPSHLNPNVLVKSISPVKYFIGNDGFERMWRWIFGSLTQPAPPGSYTYPFWGGHLTYFDGSNYETAPIDQDDYSIGSPSTVYNISSSTFNREVYISSFNSSGGVVEAELYWTALVPLNNVRMEVGGMCIAETGFSLGHVFLSFDPDDGPITADTPPDSISNRPLICQVVSRLKATPT